MTIEHDKILEIRATLRKLLKVKRPKIYSQKEAFGALTKDINALAAKGYQAKEIANILKENGLLVSALKIKNLLTEVPPKHDKGGPHE